MLLKISARHSDLARLQAYRVGEALKKGGLSQGDEVAFQFRASLGDLNQEDPLWKMPEKGVFTEDFLRDLREGSADMVVHSWKDLPTVPRSDTEILATLPRADVRDVLLFRRDRENRVLTSKNLRILTSSPRRSHNLGQFFCDHLPFGVEYVEFVPVRGNIPTRLRKLLDQDVDGLIVAKAAIDRLIAAPEAEFADAQSVIRKVLDQTRFMVLPLTVNPTAAAQGALAIEVRGSSDLDSHEHLVSNDVKLRAVLAQINCHETFVAVEKERKILASYGGGCHQKIGVNVLRRSYGELTFLRGLTDKGEVLDQIHLVTNSKFAQQPGPASLEMIFPREGEDAAFFNREYLPRQAWESAEGAACLWIARENALPESFQIGNQQIVWTAGLSTWKSLAARGVWVNGSAEGLGESEVPRLEALLNCDNIFWTKLTHVDSVRKLASDINISSVNMQSIATYRLVPREQSPNLKGRTHFYWMSGSAFDRAISINPELRNAHHACGPGHTLDHLQQCLGSNGSLNVYLTVKDWRAAMEHTSLSAHTFTSTSPDTSPFTSEALFQRSLRVAPGGVHSPVRAFKSVGGTPVFFASAEGATLTSVEGTQYIDFCQSFGPLLLGHRDPDVAAVVRETTELAWSFGACEPYSLELAEWMTSRLPWMEKLRFVSSGTEAVMSALRVARAATKRSKILKFEGCYHGHVDSLLVKAGSGLAGEAASDSAGVSQAIAAETLIAQLDDESSLDSVFALHGKEIAAVIIEPLPANYGLLLQRKEFLEYVAKVAKAHGALLIFDEVISGFRVGLGGMAGALGIKPDLVTYGKVIGGGFPVGCYGGRKDLMDLVAPNGPVYQAGTLSANPVGMRAGLATLQKAESNNVYEILDSRCKKFVDKLSDAFHTKGIPIEVARYGSIFWLHQALPKSHVSGVIRRLSDIPSEHGEKFKSFFHACLQEGVYLAPSGYEVGFLGLAHTEVILDEAIRRIVRAAELTHA